jgi:hypothetical protein
MNNFSVNNVVTIFLLTILRGSNYNFVVIEIVYNSNLEKSNDLILMPR